MHNTDHLRKGENVEVSSSLIAGCLSGLVARCGTAPMDTLKIRLQIIPVSDRSRKIGLSEITEQLLRKEGVKGLWKGNVPGSMMYIIYGGVQFSSYSLYNNLLSPMGWSAQFHSFIVGAMAGMSSSVASYPFDVLRTRFVANRNVQLSSVEKTVREIWKEKGLGGFFKGCTSSMLTITLTTSIMFSTYESIKIYCDKTRIENERRWWHRALDNGASSIGGIVSKFTTFPLDTIRRRMVLSDSNGIHTLTKHTDIYASYKDNGLIRIGIQIIRQEGIQAFYKGLSMALLKSVPSTVISLWTFETYMKLAG